MRKGGGGDDETFTGFVRRLMRGDRSTEEDKVGTMTWWMEAAEGRWIDGGARCMVGKHWSERAL